MLKCYSIRIILGNIIKWVVSTLLILSIVVLLLGI